MLERTGWALLILAGLLLTYQLLRIYQRHNLQVKATVASSGQARLTVIVTQRCAICPAQKKIVAQIAETYPPSLLHIEFIDAETQMEQARKFSALTVPTTILHAADGAISQVNNGFATYATLTKQLDKLINNKR